MLEALYEAERILPDLLHRIDGWSGLYADTERPDLTRVWRQWGENRISLHAFGACEPKDVFPHPHEWDSAIRVLDRECEMGLGYGTDPASPPEEFCRIVMSPGSAYQMVGPRGWHWVRPTGPGGYRSVMVSGPPHWRQNRVRVNTPARALTPAEIAVQLERFRWFYPR